MMMLYMEYDNNEIHKTQYSEISSMGSGPCLFLLLLSFSMLGLDI